MKKKLEPILSYEVCCYTIGDDDWIKKVKYKT